MDMDWANSLNSVKLIQSNLKGWIGQVGGYEFQK
jgi:hypothetical protein